MCWDGVGAKLDILPLLRFVPEAPKSMFFLGESSKRIFAGEQIIVQKIIIFHHWTEGFGEGWGQNQKFYSCYVSYPKLRSLCFPVFKKLVAGDQIIVQKIVSSINVFHPIYKSFFTINSNI